MPETIKEQRYGPTTGAGSGWLGLLMSAAVVVVVLLSGVSPGTVRAALGALLVGVVIWCYMLRPRIVVREVAGLLVLRNAFSTWEVPLAAIGIVQVRAVTRVEVDGRGYDGIAVGRRIKAMVRGMSPRRGDGFADAGRALGDPPRVDRKHPDATTPEAIADLMTEQVLAAAERARQSGRPTGEVLRRWAWVELVGIAVLAVGFLATFVA